MTSQPTADQQALLERLFSEYHGSILNYLYRMVGDGAQAEELAQDVFVRAFRALPRLPVDANFRAWLYRIATNASYDVLRRRRLIQWLALRDTDEDDDAGRGPEKLAEQQAVQRALMRVPEAYRSALVLFSVQGDSVREIAETLGLSEGAVKTRLSRAREMFRKAYEHEA